MLTRSRTHLPKPTPRTRTRDAANPFNRNFSWRNAGPISKKSSVSPAPAIGKVGHHYDGSQSAAVERYAYTAYGERVVLNPDGTEKASGIALQPYGHTGRRHDDETGLQYFRARYFDPELGRFVMRDFPHWDVGDSKPISSGYRDGMSLYRAYFVPNQLDPTGMAFFPLTPRAPAVGSVRNRKWTGYSSNFCKAKCGEGPVTVNIIEQVSLSLSIGAQGKVMGGQVGVAFTVGVEASVTCDLSGKPFGDGEIQKRLKVERIQPQKYVCDYSIPRFWLGMGGKRCYWKNDGKANTIFSEDRVVDTSDKCCVKEKN
jgi:RHS repeat-associated protein